MGSRLNRILYLICILSDFAAFIVIFMVTRGLAERHVEPWYLGVIGASFSFSAGVGSILAGFLAHRFDGRAVFISGAIASVVTVVACGLGDPQSPWFLPRYCLLAVGLSFQYPPLIGWLNQGEDAYTNRRGVSRTLILYCLAWNLGLMCGQLAAGRLFPWGPLWTYGMALAAASVNLGLAIVAVRQVVPSAVTTSGVRTHHEHQTAQLAGSFKRLSWIANLGGMFGGSMVIHLLPNLAVDIGIRPEDHGDLLASWRVVIIATYLIMHFAGFWHYRFSTSLAAQGMAIAGLIVIAQASSAGMLLVGLALLGQLVGYNYFSGIYYSTAGSSQERRALSAGIHEATLAAGMAIGTIAGGFLGSWFDPRMPYLMAAVVMLVLIVVQSMAWWQWVGPRRRLAPTEAPAEMTAGS